MIFRAVSQSRKPKPAVIQMSRGSQIPMTCPCRPVARLDAAWWCASTSDVPGGQNRDDFAMCYGENRRKII